MIKGILVNLSLVQSTRELQAYPYTKRKAQVRGYSPRRSWKTRFGALYSTILWTINGQSPKIPVSTMLPNITETVIA